MGEACQATHPKRSAELLAAAKKAVALIPPAEASSLAMLTPAMRAVIEWDGPPQADPTG